MSRKRRPRSGRPWPIFALAAAGVLAAAWWFFARAEAPLGPSAAATLASYRPPDLHALAVAPIDTRALLFGHHQGMLASRDGGATWMRVSGASGDAMGVALPSGSRTAYAAGHDVFFRSDDGGATWRSVRPALPGTDVHGLAASAATSGTYYAFVVGHGLFKSADGGATWSSTGTAPGSTMSLACLRAGDADLLYAATMEGVARSRDDGKTWERVVDLAGAGHVSATGAFAYAAAGSVVYASRDGGRTWERRGFQRGGAALVAVAPADPQVVYVVTERLEVWRSANGGTSWERVG